MPAFACPSCNQPLVPPPQGGRGRCPRCAGEVTFPLSASMVPGASAGPAPSSDAATLSPAGIGPDTPTRTGAPPAMAPAVADDPTESLGLPTIPGYQILGVLGR